jgi:hypothetical protein
MVAGAEHCPIAVAKPLSVAEFHYLPVGRTAGASEPLKPSSGAEPYPLSSFSLLEADLAVYPGSSTSETPSPSICVLE